MNIDIITKPDLESFKNELLNFIQGLVKHCPRSKRWLKSDDVQEMLGISASTLQNLRQARKIPFTRLGGVYYYPEQKIIELLEKNLKEVEE